MIIDFVTKLELLAEQSKLKMRKKIQNVEVAVNQRMKKILDQLKEWVKTIQVTSSSTKTNALKIRKKRICQHGLQLCSLEKLWLMKHSSETHQKFVNQSLELMQVNSTPSQCVKICQDMICVPTELFLQRDASLTLICRNPRLDKIECAILRICSCLFTRKQDQNAKLRVFFTSEKQKKIDAFNVDGHCDHCKTGFEAVGCYFYFCSYQEAHPAITDQDIERGNKKREMDQMIREYIKEKGYKFEEMWECEWCESFKTNDKIKSYFRTHFPYKRPLSTDSLLAKTKDGSLFGYVQCNLNVPDELKSKFANFPPIFIKTEVGRNNIGEHMKNYASRTKC